MGFGNSVASRKSLLTMAALGFLYKILGVFYTTSFKVSFIEAISESSYTPWFYLARKTD